MSSHFAVGSGRVFTEDRFLALTRDIFSWSSHCHSRSYLLLGTVFGTRERRRSKVNLFRTGIVAYGSHQYAAERSLQQRIGVDIVIKLFSSERRQYDTADNCICSNAIGGAVNPFTNTTVVRIDLRI